MFNIIGSNIQSNSDLLQSKILLGGHVPSPFQWNQARKEQVYEHRD